MSYLILNSSNQLFRLGFVHAAKILVTSSSPPQPSSLFNASGNGCAFTAKYYHSLNQKKDKQIVDSHKAITLSSALRTNKLLCARLMSSEHGDHVKLWTAERILGGALVPLVPMALMMPCPLLDSLLAFTLTIHSHWGIEALVIDYVRPSIFGEAIPKFAIALVYGLSAMTLGGLFYFIYADVGIAQAIRMLWKL